jgi:hypothetical protein
MSAIDRPRPSALRHLAPVLWEHRSVSDSRLLPQAPPGAEWKLIRSVETAPPQYTFELRKIREQRAEDAARAETPNPAATPGFDRVDGDHFVAPGMPVSTMTLPDVSTPLRGGSLPNPTDGPVTIPRLVSTNATLDLGRGVERSSYAKTSELYSGALSAGLVNQRAPMRGSHTSSRETAVTSLEFDDKRGFFGGAAQVDVELVPQHTLVQRSSVGGQMLEQRQEGVVDESLAVRVRLERGEDGAYRAQAGENQAFFVTSSEGGYATRILEDINVAVIGLDGTEDTAFGARYGLL